MHLFLPRQQGLLLMHGLPALLRAHGEGLLVTGAAVPALHALLVVVGEEERAQAQRAGPLVLGAEQEPVLVLAGVVRSSNRMDGTYREFYPTVDVFESWSLLVSLLSIVTNSNRNYVLVYSK